MTLSGCLRLAGVGALAVLSSTSGCIAEAGDAVVDSAQLIADIRIGSEASGPEYQFTTISFVAARGDDVYVAQHGVNEIRVFGSDGRHRKTIGRQGAGPGEFDSIWTMGIVGDSIWTIDINLRRLTFFTLGGSLISTVAFDPVPPTLGQGLLFLPYPESLMREGDFLGFGRGAGSSLDKGEITANPLLRMTPDGRTADTLGWVSIRNDPMIFRSARSRSFRNQPFSDSPLTAFAPASRRAYVIERWSATESGSASVRVTAFGADGDTAWVREIPYAPAPLDPARIDSVREAFVRAEARRYAPEEINRAMYQPSHRTPVIAAVAAENGSLWIRWDEETRPGAYTVLNDAGDVVAHVSALPRIRLKWVADSIAWGEELDENDVPTLVRYRITARVSNR